MSGQKRVLCYLLNFRSQVHANVASISEHGIFSSVLLGFRILLTPCPFFKNRRLLHRATLHQKDGFETTLNHQTLNTQIN